MYKIFILLFCIFSFQICLGSEFKGRAQFNYNPQIYSAKDSIFLAKKGNDYLRLYENTESIDIKKKYLKDANRYFYICTKADFSNIDCHIGLGKTYDEMGVDKYAKMEFNSAYNIDNKNPKLNYRYGDFYYKRKQLNMAQHYFERAYNYGYSKNLDLNKKMSTTYTKLAETQKANQHLKIVTELEKQQKQQKVKVAVSSAIKQSSGYAVVPVTPTKKPEIKNSQTVSKAIIVNNPKPDLKRNKNKFEEAVLKANKIKMIDDVDNLKPMYYLFIK